MSFCEFSFIFSFISFQNNHVHALWRSLLGWERRGSVANAPEQLPVRRAKHSLRDAVGRHEAKGGSDSVVVSQCNRFQRRAYSRIHFGRFFPHTMYVTVGLLIWTGPLAYLSPFFVKLWIRSNLYVPIWGLLFQCFISRIEVPNKSLSHRLRVCTLYLSSLIYWTWRNHQYFWNMFEINYSQLIQYEILEKLVTCMATKKHFIGVPMFKKER